MSNKFLFAALIGTAFIYSALPASAQTIPAGTRVEVRVNDPIDSRDATDNRIYTGSTARDVLDADGRLIIPRGAQAELIVRRLGDHDFAVDLDSIRVGDRRYSIDSSSESTRRDGIGANKRTGEYVGGGAVLGTLLGAIAGGGKGAAIGALAGGAAGGAGQVLTRGREVHIPAESILTFRLERALDVFPDRGRDRDGHHYHDNDRDDDRDRDRDRR
jgi:hypothetical protein